MATPGPEEIAVVRRRTAEVDSLTWSDAELAQIIEAHPLAYDDAGAPIGWDLWAAAADVWSEKASALAGNFDFNADGASYSRSQAYEQARKQASFCRSRASAKGVAL